MIAKRSYCLLLFLHSSKDSNISEILLYKAEKMQNKKKTKNDKISEKVKPQVL